jgi:hypothetical protein
MGREPVPFYLEHPMKTWQACTLFAAAVIGALLMAGGPRDTAAQPVAAPNVRWHVVTIERAQRAGNSVARDAVLVDGASGQTWIMTNAEGLEPAWLPLPRK